MIYFDFDFEKRNLIISNILSKSPNLSPPRVLKLEIFCIRISIPPSTNTSAKILNIILVFYSSRNININGVGKILAENHA